MTRRNLFAYTASGNYPAYISINVEEDGTISFTVRNAVSLEGACGETATVNLPLEKSTKILKRLGEINALRSK